MTNTYEIKKRLSAVWVKESDKSESYEFDLSAETAWGCIRSNHSGSSRFKLAYDLKTERLWWGQSYFLDPADLVTKPDKVVWYRASDPSKKKGAFLWQKLKDVPLRAPPPQTGSSTKAKSVVASKTQAKPQPKASAQVKVLTKSQPGASSHWQPKAQGSAEITQPTASASSAGPVRNTGTSVEGRNSSTRSSRWPNPELILDLQHIAVIYKPPYWKCELPDKDSLVMSSEESGSKAARDLILLRWIKDKITDINAQLFEEDFNPALSGTGFGPLAHRIDAETSGLLLVAKTSGAQRHIKSQFHKTKVSKRYVCLVHGRVKDREGLIDASIRTVRTDYMTRSEVSSSGEWAETRYQVIAYYSGGHAGSEHASVAPGYSLVACDITSGRTHQIRVHMLHLGHPLVSDDKYLSQHGLAEDRVWCPRLFLHSYRMCFRDLQEKEVLVICPLPDDLQQVVLKLGASEGEVEDSLFGQTSWQREILRPGIDTWRPSTRVLRKVMEKLRAETAPLSLNSLNSDPELRIMMNEEGISGIGRLWLAKYWDVIEIVPDPSTGEIAVKLRTMDPDDRGGQELDLDRQIESVQFQIENWQRQKQRAIAEEEYEQAAEIKRRVEGLIQELQVIENSKAEYLKRLQLVGAEDDDDGEGRQSALEKETFIEQITVKKPPKPKVEAFVQDVRDEALFPSLGGSSSKPQPRREKNVGGATSRDVSVESRQPPSEVSIEDVPVVTAPVATEVTVPPLKDALVELLLKREGYVAHINEINNDRYIRQVMSLQQPKPVAAVNKAWLKQHEELFALLRTAAGDVYVGLEAKARPKGKAKPGQKVGDVVRKECTPAYDQVVQRVPGIVAPALTYDYSAVKRKENQSTTESDGTSDWKQKFLSAMGNECRSLDELLEAVPQFAKGMGARKVNEQRELLLIFLQTCTDTFKVEKQGFGPERKFMVSAKQ